MFNSHLYVHFFFVVPNPIFPQAYKSKCQMFPEIFIASFYYPSNIFASTFNSFQMLNGAYELLLRAGKYL